MPGELLLELLSEEIPARMQRRAIGDLCVLLRDKLADAGLPAESLVGHVTPRRLAVIADGIPQRQPDRREERRGPRLGAPQRAIDGFLRAAGLAALDECEIRDTGRGEFYFAVIERAGRAAAVVLPEIVEAAIGELPWPKSMRFPAASLRWVRPLSSVVCLFDGKVLPLTLGPGAGSGVPVGRVTLGHRFLSPGRIVVESARDYQGRLRGAHVILDREERKRIIAAGLDEKAAEAGVAVIPDPGLLEEVAGLVEYPVVLRGAIDADFMMLPPEVLATAMRAHQKYFSCRDREGKPAPHFLFVANNLAADGGRAIVAGNERVLRARLADARFFWDQDRKIRLEDRLAALKQRVYHDKLGSIYDRAVRLSAVAHEVAARVYPSSDHRRLWERAQRAAYLAKADLSTAMVSEFPELQGVMGGYYALHDGEDPRVAKAIAEHYRPLGPNDACPSAPESILVALADKVETLFGFFSIGEHPTGSRDPYALRRAAIGTIRLITENELRLSLSDAFVIAAASFAKSPNPRARAEMVASLDVDPTRSIFELTRFIFERLRVHLREQGLRHDLFAAVAKGDDDDLVRLLARVHALESFLNSDDGANLLTAYRRASNIVRIEEQRDRAQYGQDVDMALFRQAEEKALDDRLAEASGFAAIALRNEDFEDGMSALASLRRPVDEFFDKVTVNADDPALRENRLRLLSRIRETMNQIADFSQIEG